MTAQPMFLLQAVPAAADEAHGIDPARVGLILALALAAHLLVRALKRLADRQLGEPGVSREQASRLAARRHPRVATVLSLFVSAATFVIYFVAIGLVLGELGVNLAAYFATATVIGLAVGFGSQGLVQDIVIGLTLIFTDAMDLGDTVEVSGQIGRVHRIGLRFTTLLNFAGQTVYVPNRNIAVVGRYRRGVVRAYVDAQVPDTMADDVVESTLLGLARGLRAQHPAIVVSEPESLGVSEAGGWRYARIKLRIWPGQHALVETAFRQRVNAAMKRLDEGYQDWMVTVTYRAQ